jgi:hypothetical protein
MSFASSTKWISRLALKISIHFYPVYYSGDKELAISAALEFGTQTPRNSGPHTDGGQQAVRQLIQAEATFRVG